MATNPVTVAGWAWDGGFRGLGNLTEATVLALKTSGGDPDRDGGVWGLGGPKGNPVEQARIAHKAWQSSAWSTFPNHNNITREFYRPAAAAAAAIVNGREETEDKVVEPAKDAAGAVVERASGVVETATGLMDALTQRTTWVRVSRVAIGAALLIVAAVMVTRGQRAGEATKTVKSTAVKAAKVVAKVPGRKG